MAEDRKKNVSKEGTRSLVPLLIVLAMLALASLVALLLSLSRRNALFYGDLTKKYEIVKAKIESTLENGEYLRGKIISLENRIDEILRSLEISEGRLVKLESHTVEGQDRSVKVLMNLNRIQRSMENGENFSSHLRLLEQFCSSNGRLTAMVSRLQDYEDIDLSDAKIKNTFDTEKAKVSEIPSAARSNSRVRGKLVKLIENNIRIMKNSSDGGSGADSPIGLATIRINNRDYGTFADVLGRNEKLSKTFEETLKIVLKRIEFNKLVDNLFRTIYNH
ncbi:MAG: hypothetical protein LBI29_01505 [Rickettsiales bacterium]|jgi:hypothetical protein|nr:hypothetical protein [Rickettsiales bacterium]